MSAPSTATILVIEDHAPLAQTFQEVLEGQGYDVRLAGTAAEARAVIDSAPPDLVLMDLVLPDADGLVLCADIKAKLAIPVIVCSGTVRKRDSVLALKLGADDFVAKPFDVDELLSRIEAALRRVSAPTDLPASLAMHRALTRGRGGEPATRQGSAEHEPVATLGRLRLERTHKRVTFGGEDVSLTPTEYRLLSAFMSRPDEVLSRRDLAQMVWGYEDASVGRSIDVHVHRLRTKLQHAQVAKGRSGPNVISVRGFGYKLLGDAAAQTAAA